jgi:cytochrome c5
MRRFLLLLICFCAQMFCARAESEHARFIRGFDAESFARGKAVYEAVCVACHGTPEREGTLPTSRPFWKEPFKNGSDPYSLFKTVTQGMGQMPALGVLTPRQRYDAVNYIREAFVRARNPSAYFAVDEKYLAGLPEDRESLAVTEGMAQAEKGPVYLRMDFGPAFFWTLQVATNNIAYKGIAVRLDEGPGGVSKGRAWMVYDHDTMRVAAGWRGEKFIDWKGIALDGTHTTHASIVGEKVFVNPVGPGWANPETGSFDDPRFLGRDGKPYGPLPREWAHLMGVYYWSNRVVISWTVGDAHLLETPRLENEVFTRTLNVAKSSKDLVMRVAPSRTAVTLVSERGVELARTNGFVVAKIAATETPLKFKLAIGGEGKFSPAEDLQKFTKGGPARWEPELVTSGKLGAEDGAFAVDEIVSPPDAANPWKTWMRFGGFDFFKDGKRAAICAWNGDVWIVGGIDGDLRRLTWKRIASGLFQPLGVKIVDEVIYVTCRDQIARLRDLNGDGEIDFIENFNNDAQVTEHFHEFAMGLQTDAEGNFYYAKSARHAKTAIVPHHGTLLKVSKDGARTEIVANGFRAANGVCVNDDGTFFVTDQEGHWTPKNRINWVKPGGFYGNMFGYHDRVSEADEDMEQPLVWITNDMDRSPGELVRVTSESWGALKGSLLNLSYGTGRIFVVPFENVNGQLQGGVARLAIADFPTGVMRGRFHPGNGHLYACGMYAWAGNRQADGGFYRVRATGKPAWLPIGLHARGNTVEVEFTDKLDAQSASRAENYAVKVWHLKRSADYGSKHYDEHALKVANAILGKNGRTIQLTLPDLKPTQCMEIVATLKGSDGSEVKRTIHNTIHALGPDRL